MNSSKIEEDEGESENAVVEGGRKNSYVELLAGSGNGEHLHFT